MFEENILIKCCQLYKEQLLYRIINIKKCANRFFSGVRNPEFHFYMFYVPLKFTFMSWKKTGLTKSWIWFFFKTWQNTPYQTHQIKLNYKIVHLKTEDYSVQNKSITEFDLAETFITSIIVMQDAFLSKKLNSL